MELKRGRKRRRGRPGTVKRPCLSAARAQTQEETKGRLTTTKTGRTALCQERSDNPPSTHVGPGEAGAHGSVEAWRLQGGGINVDLGRARSNLRPNYSSPVGRGSPRDWSRPWPAGSRSDQSGNRRSNPAISSAAVAASTPLFPTFPPARWIACSRVSQVRMPNKMGTPDSSPVWVMARLTARLMCSS